MHQQLVKYSRNHMQQSNADLLPADMITMAEMWVMAEDWDLMKTIILVNWMV